LIAALGAAMLLWPAGASAQELGKVTGVTAVQDVGFTTLKWEPVAGATNYQIERRAPGAATGTVVGVWNPDRHINPEKPVFADSGYKLGDSFEWRVRARSGTTSTSPVGAYSDPVTGTTLGHPGPANLLTAWEKRDTATDPNIANDYTTTAEEAEFTAALDAASERLRVVTLTRTIQDRPLDLYVIGYPKPPDTAAEISAMPTYWVNCNVHGNEASGRETCFTMARQLATTEDPAILSMLSKMTVLIMPSSNPDGRALNQRGNSTGQDLNRDHALIEQAETKAQAQLLRDYTPDVSIDNHEGDSEDLPILSARHLNIHEPLFEEGKFMVNQWMYGAAAQSGWWMGPYSTGGDSHEGILRNTGSLKNGVSMLGEARAAAGSTRPSEGSTNSRPNENRKAYSHLWENWEGMRYFAARMDQIVATNKASAAAQSNQLVNRTVLRGSYPWPEVPPVGVGNNAPDVDTPLAERILNPAPCGYYMTQADYEAPRTSISPTPISSGSIAERLAIHGVKVLPWGQGVLVPLKQPLGGLVAPMLDSAAVLPMLRTAVRYYGSCEGGTVGGTVPATLSLTLGAPASLGAFVPGVAREYVGATDATVISTAGDATLSVVDNGANPGHLVNGAFSLASALQAQAGTGAFAAISGSPLTLKTWSAPVSNDVVTMSFKQSIAANEPLRTGSYSKTLTFTLSTTNP
jgi:predicted deacylase